jgi:hypothetical protein
MDMKSRRAKSLIGAVVGFLLGIVGVYLFDFQVESATHLATSAPLATVRVHEDIPDVSDLVKLSGSALLDRLEVVDSAQLKRVIQNCAVGDLFDPHRVAVMRYALELLAARKPAQFLHWIDGGQVPTTIATLAIETAATILARSKSIDSILSISGA